jgi:predicted Zn-dependent protease
MATGETLALKYSREYETDADQNGLYRVVKAGYDPNGLISFLNRIYKISLTAGPKVPTYLMNHPATEDRMALLQNLLQAMGKPTGPFKKVGNFKRVQAKVFVEEREPDVAVNQFGSIVKANPQDVDGIYGLGLALEKMGRLDKSTEVFQSGLSLSPKDPDLLRELGIVYLLSGKVDPAIENLEASRSVSIPDQDSDLLTLYYLGRAYQEKEDLANALSLFLKVQKEMPEFVDVYLNLGSVYGRMGQKGLSHFYFGKHFKMRGDGRNALLHFKTALEWLEKGSPEREEVQQEIKELTPRK